MIKYRNYPVLRPLPKEGLYELTETLHIVYTDDQDQVRAVQVPKGYKTDGATLPRFLWEEVGTPFSPQFISAAIVHDWHCNIFDGKIYNINKNSITVNEMTDLFFELLRADGVSLPKALAMDVAVRMYKTLFNDN